MTANPVKKVSRELLAKIFLAIWIPGLTIIISLQMAGHILTMPIPERADFVADAIMSDFKMQGLSGTQTAEDYRGIVYHFIYQNCSCTQDLLTVLSDRVPIAHTIEKIIFIGKRPGLREAFTAKGFLYEEVDAAKAVQNFSVESAPLLAVLTSAGHLVYLGGYFPSYGIYQSADQKIISSALAGIMVDSLPLYGCAVSSRLKDAFYPLKFLRIP